MRIAVIGATGMIGNHTVRAARGKGHEAIALYRNPALLRSLEGVDADFRQADLNDMNSLRQGLKGADAVIHAAAYYPTAPKPLAQEMETAKRLMENFYRVSSELPFKKIVYVGAAISLPRNTNGKPADGSEGYKSRPKDQNPYLQVKWAQDALALEKTREGLPVVIGIPSMTFGEYDPGNGTGRFILEMANGTFPGYVAGNRNVICAGDAGRGLVRVFEDGVIGKRYLLTGENLTMQQLMSMIADVTGKPHPKEIPLGIAKLVSNLQILRYKYLKGPVPKVSSSAIAVMSSGQFLDGSKAARELGYEPEVPVRVAIRRTFEWFKSQHLIKGIS
jgi:nucleoside-diphosphate-sugar epimerase